jgi:Lon-like protease
MTTDSVPTGGGTNDHPGPDVSEAPVDFVGPGDGATGSVGTDGALSEADAARTVRRRRWWFLAGLSFLLTGGLAGALFIPTPYYLLQPGSVRPAEQRIEVDGAPSFDHEGEVLFTTVFIDRASLATLIRGAIDDAVVVRTEDEVYGGQGRRESQQVNQQRMDLSKLIATKVALDHLGYPAAFTARGARVLALSEGGRAGELLRPGDVIVAVAGRPVRLPSDIGEVIGVLGPGVPVTVEAKRPARPALGAGHQATDALDRAETVLGDVVLTESPDEPGRAVLGVAVDPVDPGIDSPVRVEIDSGDVTGPSAGLAWALAVVDRLTPGSLTEGRDVAVTGEILPDGSVGAVGGITQKVAAVKRAGVRLFLYPAGTPEAEQAAMRRLAGDDLELRPVASLDEAVRVLDPDGVEVPG